MTSKVIAHNMQAIFCQIQMAQYIGNRQWTLLHQQGVPDANAIHVCQPHNYLSPLSPEQWTWDIKMFVGSIKNLFHKAKEEGQSPYTALMVYRNTPLNGTLQSPMQILQGRQACTDLPLSHATKVKMGIKHAPRPTAEILHVKISHYLPPHMIYPSVRMSCTGNPMTEDAILQL